MKRLKRCPFCGSRAEAEFNYWERPGMTVHYISCRHCGCRTASRLDLEVAEEEWNQRVKPKARRAA